MKLIFLFFLVIIFYAESNAQELRGDSVRITLYDLQYPSIIQYDEFDMDFPDFSINQLYTDSGSVRLLSSFILSSVTRGETYFLKNEPHLLSNYHDFYIETSKINPLYYVLGMAQAGAVGYLAYRHIKKFGLK
jgi:hypothetical protein